MKDNTSRKAGDFHASRKGITKYFTFIISLIGDSHWIVTCLGK